MDIISSYGVEIRHPNGIFKQSIDIYRKALAFLIDTYDKEWDNLVLISDSLKRFNVAEHLIHSTKKNTAKYEFDKLFYKMPVYIRRDAVNAALGAVSSYKSNLKNWEKNGKAGNQPKLQTDTHAMPVFFRDNMYKETEDPTICKIKLYNGKDWIWRDIRLTKTDLDYIRKYWSHVNASAPKLEKKHKKWFLRFAFTEKTYLNDTPMEDRVICAVDLGINTDATCSIMKSDGTVVARKFIDFATDKDHLYHVLNRIKKYQKQHGSSTVGSFWEYAKRINDELSKKIATGIVSFASLHNADVIVFEHLDMKGKKSGSKKQKLHLWKKNFIQTCVEQKAHQIGIRVSHICAWNTSKLAYDGSGEVTRDESNHSICKFQNGKIYNCDLSASYNIGARYFIREILKPVPVTEQSEVLAKVPELQRRTACTLDILRKLHSYLAA